MSMVEAVISIGLGRCVEVGYIGENKYRLCRIHLKKTSGKRLLRYAICVNGCWKSNEWYTLKEAHEEIARRKAGCEIRPFKPLPIAEMRKVAAEKGYEQAYNILLLGGYGFIEGTVKDYDELLKEFERGMKDNAVQQG